MLHISASGYLSKTIGPVILVTGYTVDVTLIPLWLIGVGAAGAVAIVIGVALSGGK